MQYGKLYYWEQHFVKDKGFVKELLKDPGEWRGFFVEDYSPKTPPNILIDIDNDGTDDAQGNCPSVANPDQKNANGDVQRCLPKWEIKDFKGNCRYAANPVQKER